MQSYYVDELIRETIKEVAYHKAELARRRGELELLSWYKNHYCKPLHTNNLLVHMVDSLLIQLERLVRHAVENVITIRTKK